MNGLSRRNWIVLLALLLWFCGRTMVAVAQTASVVPVPRATLVPATADSFPFLAANRVQEVVDLAKLSYVEEEFVISGTANVYNRGTDGSLTVKTANAPYTTRILVRRPANGAKFSGNVIVEPLENTRRFDWAFLWAISHDYLTEHGDAWNLRAAKYHGFRAGVEVRHPEPGRCALQKQLFFRPNARFQCAKRVRDITHDGYLIKGDSIPIPISRCAPAIPPSDPRRITRNVSVPVIRAVAEGDVLSSISSATRG